MQNNPKTSFIVFPALDLRGGQVVRLQEGDPSRQTHYTNDPAAAARRWIEAGANWLHVVNLDGAFDEPDNANRRALESILSEAGQAGIPVQFGGGLRSLKSIEQVFALGVARVMVGTMAVESPQEMAEALNRWGAERVGASLDARDGQVRVRGWQSGTSLQAIDLARSLAEAGLRWLVFTDISRDGLQTGLNLEATVELARITGLKVIASGGVSRMEDAQQAKAAGLAGVIVGRALYENALDPVKLFDLSTREAA